MISYNPYDNGGMSMRKRNVQEEEHSPKITDKEEKEQIEWQKKIIKEEYLSEK